MTKEKADIEQLKKDIITEIVVHQHDTAMGKACNKTSCHLNIAFNNAANRQRTIKRDLHD